MKRNATTENKNMNNTTVMNTAKEMMSIELFHIDEFQYPLVEAVYEGKNGKLYYGVFIIDSGATDNQLNKTVVEILSDECYLPNESIKITSVQGQGCECKAMKLDFKTTNNLSFTEKFYASEMRMDFLGKGAVIGILGVDFLKKHNLSLDFESKTLHTSSMDEVKIENCDYYYGMEYGFKTHTIPLVPIANGDDMYYLVADTGANVTAITKHVMEICNMPISDYQKNHTTIETLTCNINADICNSTINLVSLKNGGEGFKMLSYEDQIQILPNLDYVVDAVKNDKGEEIPAICGLLSSAFMLRNKWILDFRTGVIYSRKKAA